MAVSCEEGKCWAGAGQFCRTPSGTRRRPHPDRVRRAGDAGLLGGRGRAYLTASQQAVDQGSTVTVGQVVLLLPSAAGAADAG